MDREVALKLLDIQERMCGDAEYKELCAKREMMSISFLTALEGMTREQESAVLDFLGYLMELYYKTVEYLVK